MAETSSTKSRVDLHWYIGDAKKLTLEVGLESLKSGKIVVGGKDPDKLAARLAERLAE